MKYQREDMVLFWGGDFEHANFSQWARFPIFVDGTEYNCCEQYMMYSKARLFEDWDNAANIMSTKVPREQKQWGRQVKGFVPEEWNKIARLVVYRANLAKFSQNYDLYQELMNTEGKIIVEASPLDTVWGIGLAPDNPDCLDTDKWKGTNWLGEAIMQVRSDLDGFRNYAHGSLL